jgi:hypothetical protein
MASDYLSKYVLLGYFNENQDAGAIADRDQWSEDAFNRYDAHIVAAATQAGLDVTAESRSIMAVLATMAPGQAPKTRAGQAVSAYLEYRGL